MPHGRPQSEIERVVSEHLDLVPQDNTHDTPQLQEGYEIIRPTSHIPQIPYR